ncbi:hypothetical protein [Silicimonas sp. MF1-12-2]|uniref:hypothetical protein n=1 Tax=Silicimonas sp. MF1-12-2 TaxID=3384793 RepID=UPI0039B4F5D8
MRRINRRHSKLSQGYVTAVTSDGLVVAKPQRRARRGMLRGLAMVVVVMMLFKGALHAQLGAQSYQDRIDALAAGNAMEQAGAYFMVADPITLWISKTVVSLVR